jgi:energy-coupling factor transporter ATP-binding protein EcfA2
MKIKFTGNYKSITPFESDCLRNFSIITGRNGSGKTHLLKAIDTQFNSSDSKKNEFKIEFTTPLKRVQYEGLKRENFIIVDNTGTKMQIQNYVSLIQGLQPNIKKLLNFIYQYDLKIEDFSDANLRKLNENHTDLLVLLNFVLQEHGMRGHLANDSKYILPKVQQILNNTYANLIKILFIVKEVKALKFEEIKPTEFFSIPLDEEFFDRKDLFYSQLETIFYAYSKKRFLNDFLFYRKSKAAIKNNAIPDEEFKVRFPPPWCLINSILESNSIPLRFTEVDLESFLDEGFQLEVTLKKEGIDTALAISDLSSGEQIILGLALKLFTSEYYNQTLLLPDLVLLDEPDAFLHPEMSKLLIDVLYKSFTQDLGIKVLITTHSPSTIALAPDDCIYQMNNLPGCSLKSISKDEALNILTGSLPTLSIDYKNHKQVFVESPTDVYYYQKIFDKLSTENTFNHKLYFISNSKGKSNCDWVIEIVKKMRDGGIQKAYGIIDWDGKNNSSNEVLVHGEKARYSIENFIYDPLYIAILFLNNSGAHNIRSELSFDEAYNPYSLANESNEKLQQVSTWILSKLSCPANNNESIEIQYFNSKKISLPKWYLTMKGHDLEQKLKDAFSFFVGSKYRNDGKLQEELIITMARCYPLIPIESVNIIKSLCS